MTTLRHKKESAHHGKASGQSDRKRDSMILAGLAGILAFIAVYAEAGNAKIVFALASGIAAAAIIYFTANSGFRRKV